MNTRFLVLSCFFLLLSGQCIHAFQEGKPAEVEEFTGRTEAKEKVEVRSRVSGYITKTVFKEGDLVKKNELLFEIDARPYQAQVALAQANLGHAQAQLQRAGKDFDRAAVLRMQKAISNEEYEQIRLKRAEAEASVKLAEIKLDTAKLDLDFTKITSAIDGRAGRYLVTEGNVAEADKTILTTILSVDPMYLSFDVAEESYLRIAEALKKAKGKLQVQIEFQAQPRVTHAGTLEFIDSYVDPKTGAVRGRAMLANKEGMLLPGMFARVRVPVEKGNQKDPAPKEATPGKLKALLKERHALLAKAADSVKKQYQAGRGDLPSVLLAERAAFDAGLEACENSAQRIELIRQEFKSAEGWLKFFEKQLNSGAISQFQVLRAQALVLELRIRLLREEER